MLAVANLLVNGFSGNGKSPDPESARVDAYIGLIRVLRAVE